MTRPSPFVTETPRRLLRDRLPSLVRGRRALVALGLLVIGLGLVLNWRWLVAVGAAPLIVSVLPCLAMCALGFCMNQMVASHDKVSLGATAENDGNTGLLASPRSCCASVEKPTTTETSR
ncbi:hypothetical protein [Rhizobium laguerreae]|uniref:hypothetical protein n=1 Tax=Rhizobium laguerreae TaxID=1076926 RepID=UPI001AEE9145|nr:hypothetical protein [Rhizobium laguerreae]